MNVIKYPQKEEWDELLKRPVMNVDTLRETVCRVLDDVKTGGDRAVMAYEKQFDHVELERLAVTEEEMDEAERLVSPELKDALRLAHDNIGKFHASQRFETTKVEVRPGVTCWQKAVPIERVGLYIPGGTAPLFSTVLMLATPAKIAGCREIVLCTPPGRDGKVHPAILCAARVAGVNRIFKAGGVQAIGAMAYGTESVPKVYKIFGPGNQYVMAAKQQVSLHDVAIDMPAGPSEVEVLADAGSNPVFVAADLLSQAEHGVDSQVLLVTTDEALVGKVQDEVERQLAALPRKEIAEQALTHSKLVVVRDMDEALELTNRYAPEHLIIETARPLEGRHQRIVEEDQFGYRFERRAHAEYLRETRHRRTPAEQVGRNDLQRLATVEQRGHDRHVRAILEQRGRNRPDGRMAEYREERLRLGVRLEQPCRNLGQQPFRLLVHLRTHIIEGLAERSRFGIVVEEFFGNLRYAVAEMERRGEVGRPGSVVEQPRRNGAERLAIVERFVESRHPVERMGRIGGNAFQVNANVEGILHGSEPGLGPVENL